MIDLLQVGTDIVVGPTVSLCAGTRPRGEHPIFCSPVDRPTNSIIEMFNAQTVLHFRCNLQIGTIKILKTLNYCMQLQLSNSINLYIYICQQAVGLMCCYIYVNQQHIAVIQR